MCFCLLPVLSGLEWLVVYLASRLVFRGICPDAFYYGRELGMGSHSISKFTGCLEIFMCSPLSYNVYAHL